MDDAMANTEGEKYRITLTVSPTTSACSSHLIRHEPARSAMYIAVEDSVASMRLYSSSSTHATRTCSYAFSRNFKTK